MAHLAQRTFEPLNIAVLTISDTRTFETDSSGQTLTDLLQTAGHVMIDRLQHARVRLLDVYGVGVG